MTDEQIHAAALADPDAQPLTEEQVREMNPSRALNFCASNSASRRSSSPNATAYRSAPYADSEQHRTEPDRTTQSYVSVIEAFPDVIAQALSNADVPNQPNTIAMAIPDTQPIRLDAEESHRFAEALASKPGKPNSVA